MILEPDKFGYYEVGNRRSYSKLEAAEWGQPRWHFNDEIYSAIDWTIEPTTNLYELYKMRAKQIREEYDHVVLFYSGGADSHNMLKAWLDADCKIDEICTYWDMPSTNDPNSIQNAEIIKVVLPHVESLKATLPYEFMHTKIDMMEINQLAFTDKSIDFQYNMNFWWVAYALSKSKFRETIPHWKSMIAAGKKVVFVYGMEKPWLMYEPAVKKYYSVFQDMLDDNGSLPYMQRNMKNGWFDEFFYWTPDFPLITIKQCHILKNFVTTVLEDAYYDTLGPDDYLKNYSPVLNMKLKNSVQDCLLYPKWDPNTFSTGKAAFMNFKTRPTGVIGAKDPVFLKTQTDASKNYLSLFRSAVTKFKSLNQYATNRPKPYYSKRYWLS